MGRMDRGAIAETASSTYSRSQNLSTCKMQAPPACALLRALGEAGDVNWFWSESTSWFRALMKGFSATHSVPKVADGGRVVNYIKEYLYSFFTTFIVEKQTIELLRVKADVVSCMSTTLIVLWNYLRE